MSDDEYQPTGSKIYKPNRNTRTFNCLLSFCVEYFNYDLSEPRCSGSSSTDGSFICDFHLLNFFRMEKATVKLLPSMPEPMKTLVGMPIISQYTPKRVLIPLKNSLEDFISLYPPIHKAVFYILYEEDQMLAQLCDKTKRENESYGLAMDKVISETRKLLSRIEDGSCVNIANQREYDGERLDNLPKFFKHMIEMFLVPRKLILGTKEYNLFPDSTTYINNDGLILKQLYNPMERKSIKPTFSQYHLTTSTILRGNKSSYLPKYNYNDIVNELKVQLGLINGTLTITEREELL